MYEYGEWKNRFGQEEIDLFMLDTNFSKFVEAQQEGNLSTDAAGLTLAVHQVF